MTQTTSQVEAAVFQIMGMVTDYMLADQPSNTQRRAIETALRAALASQQEVPDARTFCQSQVIEWATSKDWMAGWDACRREFPFRGQQEVAAPVTDADVTKALLGMRFTATGLPKPEDMRRALEGFAASRVPVAAPAEPEGDVQLRACDQTTGREYFIKKGPRAAIQAEADAMNEKGRDYFVIPPLPETPPVGAGGAGVMDAVFIHWTSDVGYLELWLSKHDEDGHVFPLAGPVRCPPEFAAILAKGGDQGEGK